MTGISRRTFGLAAGFGAIGAGGLGGGCSTRSGPTPTPEPASRGVGVVLSHEQFRTDRLVAHACRRASWLPVCVGQRPPTAMARQRGPFDVSLADPGVGGQQHQQHLVRHRGDLSHIPLPSGHRRSGVCLAGDPEPRTGVSGAGHRRAAQRTSRHRHVRQLPRAPRPADRGHRTDPPAVER